MDVIRGQLDGGTYDFFRYFGNEHQCITSMARWFSCLGSYWFASLLLLTGLLLLGRQAKNRTIIAILACYILGVAATEDLVLATQRMRPAAAERFVGTSGIFGSFPARSVYLFSFGWLALGLALDHSGLRKRALVGFGLCAAVLIVLMCLSQLILCVHFVTDIIAGLALSGAMILLARHFACERKT